MRPVFLAGAALAASIVAGAAQGAVLYSFAGPTAAMSSPDLFTASFDAGAGSGTVAFQIDGYASLDGDNFFIDIFTLTLNGSTVFQGTYDLGGGGANRTLVSDSGASVTIDTAGHRVLVSTPVTFTAGLNSLVFAYDSPGSFEGSSRAGFQGLGDEGWGLRDIRVSGAAPDVGGVPEPAAWGLMIAGFGAAGGALRLRRRSAQA